MSHKQKTETFRKIAAQLTGRIYELGEILRYEEKKIREQTIGNITEAQEKGEHYEEHILTYIYALEVLADDHNQAIYDLGKIITQAVNLAPHHLSSKIAKNFRRDKWLQLATALEPLAGRPSKKIASLIIDDKNNLLAWDTNHLVAGIGKRPDLYAKNSHGDRGHHIWCAERNVMIKFLGIEATAPEDYTAQELHRHLEQFTLSLIGAAVTHSELQNYTLVTSHYPCSRCADVIAPQHGNGRVAVIKEVVASWNLETEDSLKHPDRKTANSEKKMKKAGITVRRRLVNSAPV